MSDVYENCPAFENDKFLLRFSQLDDAGDLVSVYNRSQIYWGITSYTKGLMTFAGDVTTNRGGFYLLGDIEFDGSASGNIMGVTTKRGTNTATLSGFMIDAKGVSFTAPDVSSSLTY